jgi:hypothetical protein
MKIRLVLICWVVSSLLSCKEPKRLPFLQLETSEKVMGGKTFVHAGYLMLVDKQKRLRGAYDGTLDADVKKLMEDMDVLLKE